MYVSFTFRDLLHNVQTASIHLFADLMAVADRSLGARPVSITPNLGGAQPAKPR